MRKLALKDPTELGEGEPKPAAEGEPASEVTKPSEPPEPQTELFPPGPLVALRIPTVPVEVPAGGEKRIRITPLDAQGRSIRRPIELSLVVVGGGFEARPGGPHSVVVTTNLDLPGATARLAVTARENDASAEAEVELIVVEPRERDLTAIGVPEPEFVADPAGTWRSRWDGHRWQVNDGHDDYIALRAEPRARLRYLIALFAKEVVQRSFGVPGSADVLERMIEVLAHAERNLRGA